MSKGAKYMSEVIAKKTNEEILDDFNEQIKRKYDNPYRIDVKLEVDDETEEVCTVYLMKPKMPSLQRYLKNSQKDSISASRAFVFDNIVEESKSNLDAYLERFPVLTSTIANKMLEMLGFSQNVILKKL